MKLNRMKKLFITLLATGLASSSMLVNAASVGTGGVSTAFSKNSTSIGVVVGSGSSFNDNYIILGVGVGYYVFQGLEIGIDLQHWFSGDPSITKLSPQIRYVFTQPKVIKPYVGAFYRRTFIENIEDADSYGYRAGAYFSAKNGVYIGGGVVYEEYTDCGRFVGCSNTYPEFLFTVSF
ncbi:MAG: hypothetical protein DRQ44_07790 [Gammaproteobacteria bacterium]|nr:MAG: hypothetical protein DRQ44_07790 [Gammaproteobacteria bacterium]